MQAPMVCHEDKTICQIWKGCSPENCPAKEEGAAGGEGHGEETEGRAKRETGEKEMECGARDEECKREMIAMKVGPKIACREETKEICPFRPNFLMVRKPIPEGKYSRTNIVEATNQKKDELIGQPRTKCVYCPNVEGGRGK